MVFIESSWNRGVVLRLIRTVWCNVFNINRLFELEQSKDSYKNEGSIINNYLVDRGWFEKHTKKNIYRYLLETIDSSVQIVEIFEKPLNIDIGNCI